MLKMECPQCKAIIKSNLLTEVKTVVCKKCKTDIPVQQVYVTAMGYTMLWEDLVARVYKYEKLLVEAEKEMEAMVRSGRMSQQSINSMDKFIRALRDLLHGARNNFRVCLSDTPVQYAPDMSASTVHEGKLVDLSVVGACIEPKSSKNLPGVKEFIALKFSLPTVEDPFSIKGKVKWVKHGVKNRNFHTGIGVQFENLQESTRSQLWNFLSLHDMEVSG